MRQLVLVLLIGALLALPAAAAAQTQRTISVTGDASLLAANDAARVSVAVEGRATTRRRALGAAQRRLRAVIASLRRNGVADRDLRTGAVRIQRVRVGKRRRRVTRWEGRASVRAVIRTASRAGAVVDGAVGAGGLIVDGPSFFVSDPQGVFRRALVVAFRDARAKAAQLAAESGLTLGRPLSVRESSFQGTEQQRAPGQELQRDQSAPVPTKPGRSSVDAEVFVVFEAG